MIALDTNVVVRFLVEDDPAQSSRAKALLARAVGAGEAVFLSDIVLCETVGVLSAAYQLGKTEIVEALRSIVGARHVRLESGPRIASAIDRFAKGKGDFSDYVIEGSAAARNCSTVFTFDRKIQKEPGFTAA